LRVRWFGLANLANTPNQLPNAPRGVVDAGAAGFVDFGGVQDFIERGRSALRVPRCA
jgi:dihydroxyacetone kinase-like predicted kinase